MLTFLVLGNNCASTEQLEAKLMYSKIKNNISSQIKLNIYLKVTYIKTKFKNIFLNIVNILIR